MTSTQKFSFNRRVEIYYRYLYCKESKYRVAKTMGISRQYVMKILDSQSEFPREVAAAGMKNEYISNDLKVFSL